MITFINKKFLTAILTVLVFASQGIAQKKDNSCGNTLNAANREYEAGRFSQCIEMLNPCLKNLDREVVFEAYRLLSLCYLYMDNEKMAKEAAVSLLRHKPNYKDFPYFDPLDFTKLLARYDVWPKLELGIKVGVNFNSVRPIKNYSVTGSDATFLPETGYQAGVTAEYYLKKKISLNADVLFEGLNYTRTAKNVSGWNQEFKEKLRYFSIPLAGRYYFHNGKTLTMAAELGLQIQILKKTNSDIILANPNTGEKIENTIEQDKQRKKMLVYGLAGLTAKYKLGGGTLSANMRFAFGLNNVVNADKRYDNLDFILANQYVDSDFSFNPLYISLGYQFPIPGLYAVRLKK